jgi:hypothetical protein
MISYLYINKFINTSKKNPLLILYRFVHVDKAFFVCYDAFASKKPHKRRLYMDVKRYDVGTEVAEYYMVVRALGKFVFYDDIKSYIPRPDPAEVERLVDELIEGCKKWGYHIFQNQPTQEDVTLFDKISKAKADLLKLVGG